MKRFGADYFSTDAVINEAFQFQGMIQQRDLLQRCCFRRELQRLVD